jgi:cell division septation protein DedD
MTDNQDNLAALLVEETGQPKEQVEQQLAELKERLRTITESGQEFIIEGFGTFRGRNGTLHFEPNEALRIEVNQKYAGMKPIEMVEAFKQDGAGVPVEAIEDEEELPAAIDNLMQQQPLKEDEETGVHQQHDYEKAELAAANKDEKPASSQTPDKESKRKGTSKKKELNEKQYFNRRKNRAAGTWITAAAIVIAACVGGWFVYKKDLFPNVSSSNSETKAPTASTGQHAIQHSPGAPATKKNRTETAKNGDNTNHSASAYGLKGSINPRARNAYTIVIHSFLLKSTVENTADSLKQQGYRTLIIKSSSDNETYWRVGLGQFKTRKRAQQAVQKLPENLRKDHFIHRITHKTNS